MPRFCAAVIILAFLALPAGAGAQERLSTAELAELRGGYLIAQGITLGFGASVRTYVNGQLALESRLTWTEDGAVTTRTAGDVPGAVELGDNLDIALTGGLDLGALKAGSGLLLSDSSGVTALAHNLQGGNIQNLILNTASGRDLRQEIEITLSLPDLPSMQRSYGIDRLGSQIGQDMNAATLGALGR